MVRRDRGSGQFRGEGQPAWDVRGRADRARPGLRDRSRRRVEGVQDRRITGPSPGTTATGGQPIRKTSEAQDAPADGVALAGDIVRSHDQAVGFQPAGVAVGEGEVGAAHVARVLLKRGHFLASH